MARSSYKKWTEDEVKFLKSNCSKLSASKIANRLDRSVKSIYGKVKYLGIELDNRRKYDVDDKAFARNDPETSYWLGFLWADGNVQKYGNGYRISIELQYSDKDHLKKFKDFVEAEYPLYNTHNGNAIKINITSQKIFEDLNLYGIVPAKTYKNKKPKIRDKFIPYFIRGLFDGDGYFYEGNSENYGMRIEITNTKSICKWLERVTEETIDINSNTYPRKGKQASSWMSGGKNQVQKIVDWMYKKETPCLKRKYNKFKKFSLVGGG